MVSAAISALSGCGGTGGSVNLPLSCALNAVGGGSATLLVGRGEDAEVFQHIAAFRRLRRPSDAIPAAARDAVPATDIHLGVGRVFADRSRLMLGDGGPGSVYAMPADDTSASCVLTFYPQGSDSSCSSGFVYTESFPPTSAPCKTKGLRVSGIVPDHVGRVELFINRRRRDIVVSNNAFVYQSRRVSDNLNAVVLVYANGKHVMTWYCCGWKPSKSLIG